MSTPMEAECRAALLGELRRHDERLIAVLRAVIDAPFSPDTFLLRFEYDSPDFGSEFPVMLCPMNRRGVALETQKLLPEVAFAIAPDVIDAPRFEEAGLDTWWLAAEVFVPWFADCWEAAGGLHTRWPAYLAHHDSSTSFDLATRRTLREPEPRYPAA